MHKETPSGVVGVNFRIYTVSTMLGVRVSLSSPETTWPTSVPGLLDHGEVCRSTAMCRGAHTAATKVFTGKKVKFISATFSLSFCIAAPTARSVNSRLLFGLLAFRFPTSQILLVCSARDMIEQMEFFDQRVTNRELKIARTEQKLYTVSR